MSFLDLFRKPTAKQLAKRDLEDARRWLHFYKVQSEEATAQISKFEKRIKRLEAELREPVPVTNVVKLDTAAMVPTSDSAAIARLLRGAMTSEDASAVTP